MSRLPSVLAAITLTVILLIYMCSFQVSDTEVAVVKTFGKANESDVITDPGLRFRWPWPIQEVVKYDNRLRILEDTTEETPTADSKNVTITTFTSWRIQDPFLFDKAYGDVDEAERALRDKIRSHKKAVVGLRNFNEFVSEQTEQRALAKIEEQMKDRVATEASEQFGVEISYFGIKKLGLPNETTKQIFEYMKKTEQNKADNLKAEGSARAEEIVAKAEAQKNRIMAIAQRKVDEIESEGLMRVGQIYASFQEYPELRIFLDKLRALEEILKNRTSLILDTKFVPMDLFDEANILQGDRIRTKPIGQNPE